MVPCAGRIQPEHVLKVFESGMDAVCVVACEDDNCHTLQGSRRCERRVDYVRGLLEEVGILADRLLLFRLPGSAREDMAQAIAPAAAPRATEDARAPLAALQKLYSIRDQVTARVHTLPPSPLRSSELSD
jgi:nicotinamide mononucleotide adenylyltransferase